MKKFKYSARDNTGKVIEGEIEAKDTNSVADILHDRGLKDCFFLCSQD